MTVLKKTKNVPYTAKYKVTYEDGQTKIFNDKGVMKTVYCIAKSYMYDNYIISYGPESIDWFQLEKDNSSFA